MLVTGFWFPSGQSGMRDRQSLGQNPVSVATGEGHAVANVDLVCALLYLVIVLLGLLAQLH